jgi:VCBS repeat-containing protein
MVVQKMTVLQYQEPVILKLEQYQSISSAQSTDTNTSATFELTTNSQFGTTNIKTDTNISYDINTQDSSSQTLSDTTEKTNSLSVNQQESINCGGKKTSKSSLQWSLCLYF